MSYEKSVSHFLFDYFIWKKLTNEVQKWFFICAKIKYLRGKILLKISLDVNIDQKTGIYSENPSCT